MFQLHRLPASHRRYGAKSSDSSSRYALYTHASVSFDLVPYYRTHSRPVRHEYDGAAAPISDWLTRPHSVGRYVYDCSTSNR